MLARACDADLAEIACFQVLCMLDINHAVDLGRVGAGAGHRLAFLDAINQHRQGSADLALQFFRGDFRL